MPELNTELQSAAQANFNRLVNNYQCAISEVFNLTDVIVDHAILVNNFSDIAIKEVTFVPTVVAAGATATDIICDFGTIADSNALIAAWTWDNESAKGVAIEATLETTLALAATDPGYLEAGTDPVLPVSTELVVEFTTPAVWGTTEPLGKFFIWYRTIGRFA